MYLICGALVIDLLEVYVHNPVCDVLRTSERSNNLIVSGIECDITKHTVKSVLNPCDSCNATDLAANGSTFPVIQI